MWRHLYLIRHGETEWNTQRRFRGRADIGLSDRGRRQAQIAADHLTDRGIDLILCSPLARSRQTASLLAERLDLDPVECPELIDPDTGNWTGMEVSGVKLRYPDLFQRMNETPSRFRFPGGESVKEVLGRYGIDAEKINSILSGRSGYLSEIIHGPIDADQIDYLLRDAHYTGVAYGVIDFDRLMQTIKLHDGHVVVEKKGVSAIESMLVARSLMYSSVYLHKTVRIAELMLIRAVGRAEPFDFSQMVDGELMEYLKQSGKFQRDIALRLKYRKLFKRAYVKALSELGSEEKERLAEIKAKEVEDEIAERAGLDAGYVIVDAPGRDILLSEPRLKKMDVKILDNEIKPLSEYTPLANALQMRGVTDWGIMVCCPEEAKEKVSKIAEKVLWR